MRDNEHQCSAQYAKLSLRARAEDRLFLEFDCLDVEKNISRKI